MELDGGADEYESVASEGGYQPASERGRDPNQKIVSSSYCVELFRRMRWSNTTHCGRQSSSGNKENRQNNAAIGTDENGKKEPFHASALDPFCDLPSRMMRFDGAMEAWLEEIQMPREQQGIVPYAELSDAGKRYPTLSVLQKGNARAVIWYFSPVFLHQFLPHFFSPTNIMLELWVQTMVEERLTVQSTHVPLGVINVPQFVKNRTRNNWLKEVFAAMQTSKWTRNGEALQLLLARGLSHSAMSIGDMIQLDSDLYVATVNGFVKIEEAPLILPEREMMDGREETEVDEDQNEKLEQKSTEEHAPKKSFGQKLHKEKLENEKSQKRKPQKENVQNQACPKKQEKWNRQKCPPKDRRSLREELQRRRKEVAEVSK